MFTSNLTQYINEDNVNISPMTNIDTLYYERIYKTDDGYDIHRQNMAKHMPIGYVTVNHAEYTGTTVSCAQEKSDFETADGSILTVIGEVMKKNVSVKLNQGHWADSISDYKPFEICNEYCHTINEYVKQYMTKYMVNTSIDGINGNIKYMFNDTKTYTQASSDIIYGKVRHTDTSISDLYSDINDLSVNVSILKSTLYTYGDTLTCSDAESVNNMIYTHESLWQLMAYNELVPGNTYNMLYYPKYDVSLVPGQCITYHLADGEVNSQIIQSQGQIVVDTYTQVYEPFPYILKMTAVSKCQLASEATVCGYDDVMRKYVQNVCDSVNQLQPVLLQDYKEVFAYDGISPVLLDFAVNGSTDEVVSIMYDHKYGYVFGVDTSISRIFTYRFDTVLAFDMADRYSLDSAYKQMYDRMIFKKYDSNQNIKNILYTDTDFQNLTSFLITHCQTIDNEFTINGNFIPLKNAIKRDWNIAASNMAYSEINDFIKYDKWNIKYDYCRNEITYLKDQFGNEGDYNFWNKYIKSGTFAGYTYMYGQMQNMQTYIEITQGTYYNLLLSQAVSNNVVAFNNKIHDSSVFIISGGTYIANNDIRNSSDVIIYGGNGNNVNDCRELYVINQAIMQNHNDFKYANNLSVFDSYRLNICGLTLARHIYCQYTSNAITINGIDSNYMELAQNVNLYDNDIGTVIMHNCGNINIKHNNTAKIEMSNANNVVLYEGGYDKYDVSTLKSDVAYFVGDMYCNNYSYI